MPHLDDAELAHLATLARLDLDPSQRADLRADLEKVLAYVDRLADFDDPAVRPLRHPAHDGAPVDVRHLRRDRPAASDPPDPFDPASERREGRVVVPRTVEADG